MIKIILIAIGGGIGTFFRYIISGIDYKLSKGVFPVSTLVVNITGSLIIGFLWGIFERFDVSSSVRMFIFMGILGGYTTFSTFGLETFNLLRDGEIKIAAANILVTNILGIVFVFIGFLSSRLMLKYIL